MFFVFSLSRRTRDAHTRVLCYAAMPVESTFIVRDSKAADLEEEEGREELHHHSAGSRDGGREGPLATSLAVVLDDSHLEVLDIA